MRKFAEIIRQAVRSGDLSHANKNGRPVAIIFGDTGDGKSTLIAYLLGCDGHYDNNDRWIIDRCPPGVTPPKVGHQVGSETLFPAIFEFIFSYFSYIDTAGFNSNRNQETALLEFLATQVGIKTTPLIRAVFLMFTHSKIVHCRSEHTMRNAVMLKNMFHNSAKPPNVYYVISQIPPDFTKERAIALLNRTTERTLLSMAEPHEIILFRPETNNTKNEIENTRSNSSDVSSTVFDLVGDEPIKNIFFKRYDAAFQESVPLLEAILAAPEKIKKLMEMLHALSKKIATAQTQVHQQREKVSNASRVIEPVLSPEYNAITDSVKKSNDTIYKMRAEMTRLERAINQTRRSISTIKNCTDTIADEERKWEQPDVFIGQYDPVEHNGQHIVWQLQPFHRAVIAHGDYCPFDGNRARFDLIRHAPEAGWYEFKIFATEKCKASAHVIFYRKYPESSAGLAELARLQNALTNDQSLLKRTNESLLSTLVFFNKSIAQQTEHFNFLVDAQRTLEQLTFERLMNESNMLAREYDNAKTELTMYDLHYQNILDIFYAQEKEVGIILGFSELIGLNTTQVQQWNHSFRAVCHHLNIPIATLDEILREEALRVVRNHRIYHQLLCSVSQGIARGITDVLGHALEKRNFSKQAASCVQEIIYAPFYFSMRCFYHLYAENLDIEKAKYSAAHDTMLMLGIAMMMIRLSCFIQFIQQQGWRKTGYAFNIALAMLCFFTPFISLNSEQWGETVACMVAGGLFRKGVEKIGMGIVSNFNYN